MVRNACFQERVVILTIPNRNSVDWRQREIAKRSQKPACLIDSGWQNYHGAFVEDTLQFQAEIADCFRHGVFNSRESHVDKSSRHLDRYSAPYLSGSSVNANILVKARVELQRGSFLHKRERRSGLCHFYCYGKLWVNAPPSRSIGGAASGDCPPQKPEVDIGRVFSYKWQNGPTRTARIAPQPSQTPQSSNWQYIYRQLFFRTDIAA
jgi:hypothetical protein